MMSLIETNLYSTIKNQYSFKIRANSYLIYTMLIVQMIGVLFSINDPIMQSGNGYMKISSYNSTIVIVFSLMTMFVFSIRFTTESYRNLDFSFVSNRFTSNVSSIMILCSLSLISALSAALCDYLIRVIVYFFRGPQKCLLENFTPNFLYVIMNIIAFTLLAILVSSIGYFCGSIIILNKAFIIGIPIIMMGIIFSIRVYSPPLKSFLAAIFRFYFQETSLPIYSIKIIFTSALLFIISALLTNRIEVKK